MDIKKRAVFRESVSMPPKRRQTVMQQGRDLGWLEEGISEWEVSRGFRSTHSVIRRLQKRLRAQGNAEQRPRSGRLRWFEMPLFWRFRWFKMPLFWRWRRWRNRTITVRMLRLELRRAANVSVCHQTVRNRLREFKLYSRKTAVRVQLTSANRPVCEAWCAPVCN